MENQKQKKIIFGVIGLFIFLVVVFGIYKIYQFNPFIGGKKFDSRFDLVSENQSLDGIENNSVFIFRSKISLSEKEVKDILKFDPAIEYDVKKLYERSAGIQTVFADTGENESGTISAYEIKPKGELREIAVYKALIDDPDYADHEYGWSFQVKAPFQVIKTHPKNKGTAVPLESGIEVSFNREKIDNPKDFFEIKPEIKGKFEIKGNMLIFVPEQLKEKTLYEVTIKKGFKNKEEKEVLDEDYKFFFETMAKTKEESNAIFSFNNNFLELIPGKKPVISVYANEIQKGELGVDVYRIKDADEFSKLFLENNDLSYDWCSYNRTDLSKKINLGVLEKVLSTNPEIIRIGEYGGSFIELPQILENGFYIFDAVFKNKHSQVWVQVSPMSSYYAASDKKGLVWTYDFLKKEPQKGLEVLFLERGEKKISLGKTDEQGILNFSTPDGMKSVKNNFEEYQYKPALIKIESGGSASFLNAGERKTEKGNLYWNHLSTDRSIYQMTDNLKFWGIIKGRETDMREKKVKVEMFRASWLGDYFPYSTNEEPLDSKELSISSFDTISGEFSFRGYAPGYYNLKVKFGEDEIANATFEILTYTKPAYQIEIIPSKNRIFAGEGVNFHIKASFFDGTPVSGGELKYSSWGGQNFEGEIKLNENGEADLNYSSEYVNSKNFLSYFTLNLSPKYAEEGEITGSTNIEIFGPDVYLQTFYDGDKSAEGKFKAKLNKINLGSEDYIGEPAEGYEIKAEIFKIIYEKNESGEYYDPIEKITRKNYNYEKREEKTEELSGKTDKNGEWEFKKKLDWKDNVYYKVVFSAIDKNGRMDEREEYPYNLSYFRSENDFRTTLNLNGGSSASPRIISNDNFKFGEKAKLDLEITGDKKDDHSAVLFYRYQNNIDKYWISQDGKMEDEFKDDMIPSMTYSAVILGPYGFEESNTVRAILDTEEKKLNVEIIPEKDKYKPKEKAMVNLKISDKNNSPVESEINVSVVDESIFHVMPYDFKKEILSDLLSPIYTNIISGGSKYFKYNMTGAEMGGCFLGRTKIEMSDGTKKPIEEIRVGDKILTFSDENKKSLEPAIVQGTSNHKVRDYLVINDILKVTPEHRIFVNNDWKEAGYIQKGDILWNKNSQKIKVEKIERIFSSEVDVYNIIVGDKHTYLAENLYVHNEEKGGASRINFVDMASFQNIRSDKNGKASFEFVLPDNLTAWRATVKAYDSKNIQAGEKYELIKSGLPFFVDATLGNYYLEGDRPVLRLRFFGSEYIDTLPIQLSIKSPTLKIDRSEIITGSAYELPLDPLLEGEHEFTISVKQSNLEDTLVRKIKIVKSYFKTLKSKNYNPSDLKGDIEGSKDGMTTLVFSDSGKGKYYNNLWGAVYFDGLRVEKVVSSFWAKKLLKEFFAEDYPLEDLDLDSYYTEEGALSFFPNFGDSDLEVSAKIADLSADNISKDNLRRYFYKSLSDEKTDLSRVSKILYGLASLDEPVISKLEILKENKKLDLEGKLYLALAFSKVGEKEKAREYYKDEIRKSIIFENTLAWIEDKDSERKIKLTSLGALLASHLDEKNDLELMFNYINENNLKNDLNLIEKISIIKENLPRSSRKKAEFSYKMNIEEKKISLENGRVFSLDVPLDKLKNISFNNVKGDISMESYWEEEANFQNIPKSSELSLSRSYLSSEGDEEKNVFSEGEIVKIRIKPHIGPNTPSGNYQVIDYLPSGLRPIMRTYFKGLESSEDCNPIWYPERIENNKVYFNIWKDFEKLQGCQGRSINYYARVISKGFYKADPAIIQSQEDNLTANISSEKNIEIK